MRAYKLTITYKALYTFLVMLHYNNNTAVVWTITNPQIVNHFRDPLELCWNVDCEVLIEARLDGTAVGERRKVVASRYEKTNTNRIQMNQTHNLI